MRAILSSDDEISETPWMSKAKAMFSDDSILELPPPPTNFGFKNRISLYSSDEATCSEVCIRSLRALI